MENRHDQINMYGTAHTKMFFSSTMKTLIKKSDHILVCKAIFYTYHTFEITPQSTLPDHNAIKVELNNSEVPTFFEIKVYHSK